MSAVIKTTTPFIDKECLLKALDKLMVKYTVEQNDIITERIDYQGNQKFIFVRGKYKFQYDSYTAIRKNWKQWKTTSSFLSSVEKEYIFIYNNKLAKLERLRQEALAEQERIRIEEELRRIEAERKAFVEKQRKTIIEKAKAKGYSIQEKKVKNKIKLILVKHTY